MKERILSIFVALVILGIIHGDCLSQKIIVLDSLPGDFINLDIYQEIIIDTTNKLSIDQVSSDSYSNKFKNYIKKEVRLNASSTYWIRLSIINNTAIDKFILTASNDWESVEMYIVHHDNGTKSINAVINSKNPEIGFENYKYFVFELRKDKLTNIYCKLNLHYRNPKTINLKLIGFVQQVQLFIKTKQFYLSCLAILIIMIIYNLLIYFKIRHKVYLFYVMFLTGLLGAFGLILYYSAFSNYRLILFTEQTFLTIATLGLILFFQFQIDTKYNFSLAHKYFNILLLSFIVIYFIHEIFVLSLDKYPYFTLYAWFLNIGALILYMLYINILAALKKIRPAYFFLLAITILIAAAFYTMLNVVNIINITNYTEAKVILLICIIIQVVLYSLSLGDRIIKLQEEKTKAIVSNLEIQKNINKELETKVAERTSKIREKNEELEQQKEEISAQKDEVEAQRNLALEQKDQIENQNKSITDSIVYAKRIQSAILPPNAHINELLQENFIFYKPRDIVSGDFYWVKQVNQYIVVVAADCTGHGVPGAFMSMLGISYLNEIVQRREITKANQVLNELRSQIKRSLRQHGQKDESKDGMDIAMCVIDTKTKMMQYAGAFNPLYLIRDVNGRPELKEIKADRMPVGFYHGKDKSFTNNELQLEMGDTLYIFSDGFIDQIGGKENKKYMSRNFKNLLLEIHEIPMHEQKEFLDKTIIDWMKEYDQIDDILVVGFRI